MRNLLALIAFLAIVIGITGFYRGWFTVSKTSNPEGKTSITVDVDGKKIQQDREEVGKVIQGKE